MRSLRFAALLLVMAGCGGGDSAPSDIGDACVDFAEVFCDRAQTCDLILPSENLECVNVFFAACCVDDGTCNQPITPPLSASEWNRCLNATSNLACTDVENGNVPTECLVL